jgi:hypothetical protein
MKKRFYVISFGHFIKNLAYLSYFFFSLSIIRSLFTVFYMKDRPTSVNSDFSHCQFWQIECIIWFLNTKLWLLQRRLRNKFEVVDNVVSVPESYVRKANQLTIVWCQCWRGETGSADSICEALKASDEVIWTQENCSTGEAYISRNRTPGRNNEKIEHGRRRIDWELSEQNPLQETQSEEAEE